jgi:uncharacterized Zn finger protein (UPF0148 family)
MDDEDYPTVASTAPVFYWDSLLYCPSHEQLKARYEAKDAEVAAHEARCKQDNEIKETKTEVWKRVSNSKQIKAVKSVKSSAKKWVKQKKMKSITQHFSRK